MEKQEGLNNWMKPVVLMVLVILSRLPFIFNGFGTEEDSWGLVLNAIQMKESGGYSMSRLPGHPVHEIVLSLFSHPEPWVFNGLSMMFGALAVMFFYFWLKKIGFSYPFIASMALAFVPVMYLSNVYTIDYAWALALICGSLLAVEYKKFMIAGILLGFSGGCRMSSLIMGLPLLIIAYEGELLPWLRNALRMGLSALLIAILCYIPPYLVYGWDFFGTYSLPYPPIAKVFFKGSIGVWGVSGILALVIVVVSAIKNIRNKTGLFFNPKPKKNKVIGYWTVIFLHLIIYILLPEKSAFWIPALPFMIVLIAYYLKNERLYFFVCLLIIISPFVLSVNLSDPHRGAMYSEMSIKKTISGQEVFFDVFTGPIYSDMSKRKNKEIFCDKVLNRSMDLDPGSVIISEWWYNQLEVKRYLNKIEVPVRFVSWLSIDELEQLSKNQVKVYYLPEAIIINQRRIGNSEALKNAVLFPL